MSWYNGINNPEQLKNSSPESVWFHGSYKSLIRMFLELVGKRLQTPQPWLDQMDGNMAVIRDIYYEYLQHETQTTRKDCNLRGQQDRKTVISSDVPFSLVVCNYDPNFAEVANWFLFQICQAYDAGMLTFDPYHINPNGWFKAGTGRLRFDWQGYRDYLAEHGIGAK